MKINLKERNFLNLGYILNYFLPSYIFFICYILGEKSLSVNLAIIVSLNQLLIFSMSAHKRNLFLSKLELNNLSKTIIQRLLLSMIIIFINIIFLKYYFKFNFEDKYLYLFVIFLILSVWIKELIIFLFEKINQETYKFFFLLEIIILFFLLIFVILEYVSILLHIKIILIFNLIFIFVNFKNLIKFRDLNTEYNKYTNENYWFYFSSLSISISAFILRILIEIYYESSLAADYIIIFAIGSLMSSIFINSFGIKIILNHKFMPKIFKLNLYMYFFSGVIFFIINLYDNSIIPISKILWPTLFGSLIFFASQKIRLRYFVEKKFIIKIMKKDILLSIIQILLFFVILVINKNLMNFYYLIISFISIYLYYFFNYRKIS